jgi:hypothetical protein
MIRNVSSFRCAKLPSQTYLSSWAWVSPSIVDHGRAGVAQRPADGSKFLLRSNRAERIDPNCLSVRIAWRGGSARTVDRPLHALAEAPLSPSRRAAISAARLMISPSPLLAQAIEPVGDAGPVPPGGIFRVFLSGHRGPSELAAPAAGRHSNVNVPATVRVRLSKAV